MSSFAPATRAWFGHAFGEPTQAQREAWPLIQAGGDVLVVAPTGSGKTLAAFLSAIDGLMKPATATSGNMAVGAGADADVKAIDGNKAADADTKLEVAGGKAWTVEGSASLKHKRSGGAKPLKRSRDGVKVLYISPLKALGVDVERNLRVPLEGIAAECVAEGLEPPDIDVAIRSGDTTAKDRRRIVSHPPDILITTPESLYLLLTSKARRILKTVETVILDEVHAVAGSKRGAHLALSLERLDLLTARKPQRIGLSATVKPLDEAARFLGSEQPVSVVDAGQPPDMDLRIVEPVADMGALGSSGGDDGGFHIGGASGGENRSGKPYGTNSGNQRISGVTPAMRALANSAATHGAMPSRNNQNFESTGDGEVGRQGDYSSPSSSASHSIWPAVERSILDEILAHHTTLVFVNSRGLAERLTARLNDLYAETELGEQIEKRYGDGQHYDSVVGSSTALVGSHPKAETIAMAHHGSVSKERRKVIENDLKHGRLRCVVATSSLELGIDMGSVDMVIQVAPPLSVSSGLQRVGRADHRVGGVSHALFYPLTRQELIGTSAVVESMRDGAIEPLRVLRNPLDILAQQTVAAAAMDDLRVDEWYGVVRRSAPFRDLDRGMFDSVVGMLTGAYNSEEFSAFRPPLQLNAEEGIISARPGAQRLAVTSGGTIPDRGTYTVVLPEADAGSGRKRVGELDEEMVYESRVGDVITLGTSTWQIQEITQDRVVVTPAPGRTARLPFWHGEGPGRDAGFGAILGSFVREVSDGLVAASDALVTNEDNGYQGPSFDDVTTKRLQADGLDDNGRANLARLLAEQRAATGVVPDDTTLVVERCQDEEGDWRVMLHSPYGRRVHEPWALAITGRLKRKYGFDGQTYATDDGIVVRLPEQERRIDVGSLFRFDLDELLRDIEEEVGDSVLFASRFRECAARSLFMPRMRPGKRVPLWQQRLRASELLAAAKTKPNFPLVLETARECLQDVYDLPALRRLMTAMDEGRVALRDVETESPSPFAQSLLFGFVGSVMYEYDSPQAERKASLLAMDPEVLEQLLGSGHIADVLDADVIKEVAEELGHREFWNELDPDDVEGRLTRFSKTHGPFTADEAMDDLGLSATAVVHGLDNLKAKGELLSGTFVKGKPEPQYLHREVFRRIRSRSLAKARKAVKSVMPSIYQSWLLHHQGVISNGDEHSGFEGADGLLRVIEQLEGLPLPARLWESAVFPSRVHDYTPAMLDELLAQGEVVWVGSKTDEGEGNAADESAKPGDIAWYLADSPLLPQNSGSLVFDVGFDNHVVIDDTPAEQTAEEATALVNSTEKATSADFEQVGRATGATKETMAQASPTASEHAVNTAKETVTVAGNPATDMEHRIMAALAVSGASYRAEQLAAQCHNQSREEVVNPLTGEIAVAPLDNSVFARGLWSLVWRGEVTNSSFAPVRGLIAGDARYGRSSASRSVPRYRHGRARVRMPRVPQSLAGLWALVPHAMVEHPEQRSVAYVETLLNRYGVVAPAMVDHEGGQAGFGQLYPLLKRMEANGNLVRGMFVQGLSATQFATRDFVDELRQWRVSDGSAAVAVDAADPVNLAGVAIPWPESLDDSENAHDTLSAAQTSSGPVSAAEASGHSSSITPSPSSIKPKRKRAAKSLKPTRRAGSLVVLVNGEPKLYAMLSSHRLILFDGTNFELEQAAGELSARLRDMQRSGELRGSVSFKEINGKPLTALDFASHILRSAGFTSTPQGMKLY